MRRRLPSSGRQRTAQFRFGCLNQKPVSCASSGITARCRLENRILSEKRQLRCRSPKTSRSAICGGALFQDHNSAGEWAAQGPPPGQRLPIRCGTRRSPRPSESQDEQRAERRSVGFQEQLLERLLELLATQLDEQPATHVQIQVATQVQTHVLTQASTRLRLLLQVLPDGLLWVLRREHQREVRVLDSTARAATLRQDESRIQCRSRPRSRLRGDTQRSCPL